VNTPTGTLWTVVGTLVLSMALSACGGGGDGGGGSTPAAGPQVVVSGAVQAPGGQVAMFREATIWQQMIGVWLSEAMATVSGVSPVPDGTPVQLVRINDAGNVVAMLASTTVSGGRYSFNLTSLGLTLSGNLVIRVANPATGVQMRAFAVGTSVNVDPTSEAAVRLVLEQIVLIPGTTLTQFTVSELSDISAAVSQLATVQQIAAGLNFESTVMTIKNAVSAEAELTAFLTAAAGNGQTTEGPGDVGNYFPFEQGNTWRYQGTVSLTGTPTVNFLDSRSITGTKVIGGVTTTVIHEENHNNIGAAEEDYEVKDTRGTILYGNNDSSDFITPQLVPLRGVHFPLVEGVVVELVNKVGLNSDLDLDGDGQPEKVNIQMEYTVLAFETVNVPAGAFPNSAKFEIRQTETFFSSAFGISATIKNTRTEWVAPGVGSIRKIEVTQSMGFADDFTETVTEDLVDVFIAKQISLATNDIIYDPNSKMIYASTPGSPGTVTPIDPVTGTTGTPIPVGNEPMKLARSDNGQYLYVGLDGEGAVQRVDLATQTPGPKFSLGSDSFFGPRYVEDIEVLPGSPQAIAVSRRYKGVSPGHAGIAIYDNGVQRPNVTPVHTGSNVIEFSQSSTTLYGQNKETTEFGFRRMSVDNSGVTILDTTPNLINNPADIEFDSGNIYASTGPIINPITHTQVGTFVVSPGSNLNPTLVKPDSSTNRVFFYVRPNDPAQVGAARLLAFDQNTFQLLGSFDIESVNGVASSLIRWGVNGLAIRTSNGQIILVQSSKLIP